MFSSTRLQETVLEAGRGVVHGTRQLTSRRLSKFIRKQEKSLIGRENSVVKSSRVIGIRVQLLIYVRSWLCIQGGPPTMINSSKILSYLVVPVGTAVCLVVLARYIRSRGKSNLPYPPGPKGLPLIGNILDLPRDIPVWEALARMAKTHRMLTTFTLVNLLL